MDKEYLNAEEASELLQINEKKLYKLAQNGDVPATKVTGKWLFPSHELMRFLNISSLNNLKNRYKMTPSAGKLMLMAGSDDPLLQLMLGWFNMKHPNIMTFYTNVGSKRGLDLLTQGLAHISLSHIYDPLKNTYNIEAVKEKTEYSYNFVIVNMFKRDIGFISKNKKINVFRDVADNNLKFVNRPLNAGTRVLTDYLIKEEDLSSDNINGYDTEVNSHLEVAEYIASGKADAGIGNAFYVDQFGLTFNRIKTESFDMILNKDFYFSEEYQCFLEFLNDGTTKSSIDNFKGYSSEYTGKIMG